MIVLLSVNHKRVIFQHVPPQLKYDMNIQDAPHLVGNDNVPVVMEPNDVGSQNDAHDGHMEAPILSGLVLKQREN